ncbi:glycoside hydrolase family 125 protein [Deinococcus planocerae]|uniref:glycoside hydrolase family 125 protein n=1 Tax=Deinococcus planocerae TaxID=1737569 RepID=UPI001FE84DC6|nr:glycoside hydrolase family 125 protein [Deinococcus planocerae]
MTHSSLQAPLDEVRRVFATRPDVARVFARCLPNTLETTVQPRGDGTTFVVTGDIPAMWLRDSAAQVWPYLALCAGDAEVRALLGGVIRQHARHLLTDPYANAFNAEPNGAGHAGDEPTRHPLVWERKFELDSLCYPLRLAHRYWRVTGDAEPLRGEFQDAARTILDVMRTEQHHAGRSRYTFFRPGDVAPTDNLPNGGAGNPVAYTGMVWSAFRPSDDACTRNYHVPGNMMAVVELRHLAEIAREVWGDEAFAGEALSLADEIERGIETHAVVEHPTYGRMYAYETDGLGHHVLMDDANVPSLLSIPYLGYRPASDETYRNTRAFVLSPDNPYFYRGTFAEGIGSPHTPAPHVWPLALAMRGLTATDGDERDEMLHTLCATTAGTDLMHESFHPDDPAVFTREWFGWANSLFSELVLRGLEDGRPTSAPAREP